MDDNYSSELAALERLAQAEEADRQRVTADNEWATRDFAALRVDYALLSEQNARLLALEMLSRKLIDQSYKDSHGRVYVDMDSFHELVKLLDMKLSDVRPWQR